MKHTIDFKQDKKLKQLERKKQRNNKQKALVFWNSLELVNIKN